MPVVLAPRHKTAKPAGRIANVDQMVVLRANMPFFFALIAFILIAIAVPEIATWLPGLIRD